VVALQYLSSKLQLVWTFDPIGWCIKLIYGFRAEVLGSSLMQQLLELELKGQADGEGWAIQI
jgi:hypothetical protein